MRRQRSRRKIVCFPCRRYGDEPTQQRCAATFAAAPGAATFAAAPGAALSSLAAERKPNTPLGPAAKLRVRKALRQREGGERRLRDRAQLIRWRRQAGQSHRERLRLDRADACQNRRAFARSTRIERPQRCICSSKIACPSGSRTIAACMPSPKSTASGEIKGARASLSFATKPSRSSTVNASSTWARSLDSVSTAAGMDAPLSVRLQSVADTVRELSPPFANVID